MSSSIFWANDLLLFDVVVLRCGGTRTSQSFGVGFVSTVSHGRGCCCWEEKEDSVVVAVVLVDELGAGGARSDDDGDDVVADRRRLLPRPRLLLKDAWNPSGASFIVALVPVVVDDEFGLLL